MCIRDRGERERQVLTRLGLVGRRVVLGLLDIMVREPGVLEVTHGARRERTRGDLLQSAGAQRDQLVACLLYTSAVDRSVPTAPAQHAASLRPDGTVSVTWGQASDPSNDLRYLVLRDGNAVGFSWGTSYVDTNVPVGNHQYAVAAIDETGNIGPSTEPTNFNVTM